MARPLRVEFEGAVYHLTGRGNARQRIFADEKDCAKFVELLVESLQRYDVALQAYVLMGNHYHLIAETRRANLGRWMHWFATAYTVYFNRRHKRVGHLFQGRYSNAQQAINTFITPGLQVPTNRSEAFGTAASITVQV